MFASNTRVTGGAKRYRTLTRLPPWQNPSLPLQQEEAPSLERRALRVGFLHIVNTLKCSPYSDALSLILNGSVVSTLMKAEYVFYLAKQTFYKSNW